MIHSTLHFLFNVIILFMDIFQLICFISIITYDYSKFEIFNFFFNNNWSQNLIKKITIEFQNNYNTEEDWESPINITFPGIIDGCDCTSYNGVIYDEKCVTTLIIENCENIFSIEKQFFNILYLPEFESFSKKGLKIKIERYNDFTYLDLLNSSKNNNNNFFISNDGNNCECPEYYGNCVDCGIIDTIGNHLCIISTSYNTQNYDCYKIKVEYDYSLKDLQLIKDFEKIFNNNNDNVNNNKDNDESNYFQYPIEFINIFEGNVCVLQDETVTFPLINYKLMNLVNETNIFINGPKNMGCFTKLLYDINHDNRWKNIFLFSMDYFLDDQMKKTLKSLPEFPYDEYINNNFTMAYRTYIGFKKSCIDYIEFIREIPLYQRTIKISFIVFLFCALVVFPYYLLLIMVIAQTELLTFYQSFILGGIYSSIIAVFMHFLFLEFNDIKEKNEILLEIANKFCGDNLSNNLFFSILKDFKYIKNAIHYSIYWTIIMFISSFIKLILMATKTYKKRIMYTLNNGNQNPIGNHNYNLITEVEIQLLN